MAQSDGRLAARCAALSGQEDFTCPGPKGKRKWDLTVGPWNQHEVQAWRVLSVRDEGSLLPADGRAGPCAAMKHSTL